VNCLALSPDGSLLATGSDDGLVRIWGLETGKQILTFRGHTGKSWARTIEGLPLARQITCLAFSPDGKRVASGITAGGSRRFNWGEVIIWDATTGQRTRTFEGASGEISFSPDGAKFARTDFNGEKVWDLSSGKELLSLEHPGNVNRLVFGTGDRGLSITVSDGGLSLWDTASGKHLLTLKVEEEQLEKAVFSPDGKLLAVASDHVWVRVWSVAQLLGERPAR
jgi:WD40 repeat protein